jgi:hypothetical protein
MEITEWDTMKEDLGRDILLAETNHAKETFMKNKKITEIKDLKESYKNTAANILLLNNEKVKCNWVNQAQSIAPRPIHPAVLLDGSGSVSDYHSQINSSMWAKIERKKYLTFLYIKSNMGHLYPKFIGSHFLETLKHRMNPQTKKCEETLLFPLDNIYGYTFNNEWVIVAFHRSKGDKKQLEDFIKQKGLMLDTLKNKAEQIKANGKDQKQEEEEKQEEDPLFKQEKDIEIIEEEEKQEEDQEEIPQCKPEKKEQMEQCQSLIDQMVENELNKAIKKDQNILENEQPLKDIKNIIVNSNLRTVPGTETLNKEDQEKMQEQIGEMSQQDIIQQQTQNSKETKEQIKKRITEIMNDAVKLAREINEELNAVVELLEDRYNGSIQQILELYKLETRRVRLPLDKTKINTARQFKEATLSHANCILNYFALSLDKGDFKKEVSNEDAMDMIIAALGNLKQLGTMVFEKYGLGGFETKFNRILENWMGRKDQLRKEKKEKEEEECKVEEVK